MGNVLVCYSTRLTRGSSENNSSREKLYCKKYWVWYNEEGNINIVLFLYQLFIDNDSPVYVVNNKMKYNYWSAPRDTIGVMWLIKLEPRDTIIVIYTW